MPDPISMDDFLKGSPAPSAPAAPVGLSADDFLKGAAPRLPDTSRRGGSAVYANPDNTDQVPFSPLQASQYDRLLKDPKTDATRMVNWFKANNLPVPTPEHVQPVIDFVRKHPTAVSPTYYTVSHDQFYGTPAEDQSANPAEARTFGQQFTDSMNQTHSSSGEGVIGALKRIGLSQQDDEVIRDYGSEHGWSGQQIDDAIHASQAQRKIEMEGDRAQWAQADADDARLNPDGAIGRFASSQLGGLVGDANPSYLVAPEVKPLTAAIQRLAPTLGHVVAPLAEQIAERFAAPAGRAAGMGAVQGGTDAVSQLSDINSGQRDSYDPLQTVEHAVVGAAMQGTLEGVLHGVPAVKRWFDDFGNHDTPEPPLPKTPEGLSQLDQDIQLIDSKGLTPSHFRTPEEVSAAAAKLRPPEPAQPSSRANDNEHPEDLEAQDMVRQVRQAAPEKPSSPNDNTVETPEETARLDLDWAEKQALDAETPAERLRTQQLLEKARISFEHITGRSATGISERIAEGSFGEKAKGYGTSDLRDPAPATEAAPSETSEPDVWDKLTAALKGAEKPTQEQADIYSTTRRERVAKMYDIPADVIGKDRYIAQLATLSGAMDRVKFNPLEDQFTPTEIHTLYDHIEQTDRLRPLEKVSAKQGLNSILSGDLPQPKQLQLLAEVAPREVIEAVVRNRNVSEQPGVIAKVFGTIRQLKATIDLSMPGNQGWGMLSHPEFYRALLPMVKQAYKGLAKNDDFYLAHLEEMKSDPMYAKLREAGVAFTDATHHSAPAEEAHATGYAGDIPVIGRLHSASEKGATFFLNDLRYRVGKKFWENADHAGVDTETPEFKSSLASVVNTLSGRGGLGALEGKASGPITTALFGPRFVASRLQMLYPPFYKSLHPYMRVQMAKSMAGAATISAGLVAIAAALGADVTTDPKSSDFGKIKVGNTRYSMFGGLSNYVTLASRLATNETTDSQGVTRTLGQKYGDSTRADVFGQFLTNKTAPVPNYVLRYWKGKNVDGSPFQPLKEGVLLFAPMSIEAEQEAMADSGVPMGLLKAVPGLFGWDVNTYSNKRQPPQPAPNTVMSALGLSAPAPSGISAEDFLKGNHPPVSQDDFLRGKPTTTANATAESILRSVGLEPTDTGIRSHATQEELYRDYNGVAVPGTSPHEKGNAIDIRPSKTVSPEDVVATLEGNGYTGVKIITRKHGSGPHWHVQWEGYQS